MRFIERISQRVNHRNDLRFLNERLSANYLSEDLPKKVELISILLAGMPLHLISSKQRSMYCSYLLEAVRQLNSDLSDKDLYFRFAAQRELEYAIKIAVSHHLTEEQLLIDEGLLTPHSYAEQLANGSAPTISELFIKGYRIYPFITYCMQIEELKTEVKRQVKAFFSDEQVHSFSMDDLWMVGFPSGCIQAAQLTPSEILDLESTGWRFVIKHFPELPEKLIEFRFKFLNSDGIWSYHDYYENLAFNAPLGKDLLALRPWDDWVHRVWENDREKNYK